MRRSPALVILILAFVALGLAYSVVNPLHEATDELRHYRFARTIATTGRLPVQGQEACRSQSHHPPLFYALGALATAWIEDGYDPCWQPAGNPFWAYRYWEVGRDNKTQYLHGPEEAFPWRGEALAAHIIRAVNILIGAGVVWLTWATGRAVWPGRPGLALGGAAIMAFNPMFLYMAGAINNDVMAALAGAAVTVVCVRLLVDPAGLNWRWGLALGGVFSLALMSKFHLAAAIVPVVAAVTWVAWRRGQWRQWLAVNGVMAGVTAGLAGWWFWRNYLLYGEPTGFREVTELWGARNPAESVGLALSELPYVWTSLWGRFGFGQIPLPQAIYEGLFWLTVVGLVGLVMSLARRGQTSDVWSLAFLGLVVVVFGGVVFGYMLVSPAGPMGRFFFPALPAFGLLLFYGLNRLILDFGFWILDGDRGSKIESLKSKIEQAMALVVAFGMGGLAMVALLGYLAPAYGRPASVDADAVLPNPTQVHFDFFAQLVGYDVRPTTVRPGEAIDIDLYWEVAGRPPGNYLLFVHLIDEAGTMVAQRDTHPGLGNFPSSLWRPGERFVDSIRLYVPETAYAPAEARLSVGLYAPEGYRLGVTGANGEDLGDALEVATVTIAPVDSPYPNGQNQNFNHEIRLIGYEYSERIARLGEPLAVTLYWEAIKDGERDYLMEVRLLDEKGQVWGMADGRPQGGWSPTTGWTAGQVVVDEHLLMVDANTPPGTYQVEVALLDTAGQRRQNIVGEDGHWIDDRLLLAGVRVK